LVIVIALLILLWLVVGMAVVGLCRAAAIADRVGAAREEARTGPRVSPRSASKTRD